MEQVAVQETKDERMQRVIQTLAHCCYCRDPICQTPLCHKVKQIFAHTKICKRNRQVDCPICKQLVLLCCHHAKRCQESKCLVPFCATIKRFVAGGGCSGVNTVSSSSNQQ